MINNEYAISIDNISKSYASGGNGSKLGKLLSYVSLFFDFDTERKISTCNYKVLNNVSLAINKGEAVAIIGANGCGKSTLLKIIAGILDADEGKVSVNGAIQALINLGAGFDRNLTGRENVRLACGLIGAKPTDKLYEEVKLFSELQDHFDKPISTYSSGMYARLGFSVAMALEPEILLIDEILSVGDVYFKNKCMQKINTLKKNGVTIIVVSHSSSQIAQLCERAVWINEGEVIEDGEVKKVLNHYTKFMEKKNHSDLVRVKAFAENSKDIAKAANAGIFGAEYDGSTKIRNLSFEIKKDTECTNILHIHDNLLINYSFDINEEVHDLNVSLNIYKLDGVLITTISTLNGDLLKNIHNGKIKCSVFIPSVNLMPGKYAVVMPIHEGLSYLYRGLVGEFIIKQPEKLVWGEIDFQYKYTVHEPRCDS